MYFLMNLAFYLIFLKKINLLLWFYFIVFLTILYITLETVHMESSVLLSLSASCLKMLFTYFCVCYNRVKLQTCSSLHS